jgi:hypothetical protein
MEKGFPCLAKSVNCNITQYFPEEILGFGHRPLVFHKKNDSCFEYALVTVITEGAIDLFQCVEGSQTVQNMNWM